MSSRLRRISIALGLVLALGLLVGVAAGDRLTGEETVPTGTTTSSDQTDPPLSTGPTPESLQTLVFERSLSECGSYDVDTLAGKYNVAVKSEETVALAVGEGWARFLNAGQDAVADGRDGCLQGFSRK